MKKVFIYSYNLELGGVERSLIGLLEAMTPDKYEVDLFLAKHEGELLSLIPEYINVLPVDKHYQAFGIPIKDAIKKGFIVETFLRLFAKVENIFLVKVFRDTNIAIEGILYHRSIIRMMKKQPKEYDLALNFSVPYYYVLNKVNAKKKVGWVHTDYKRVNIDFPISRDMFKRIDAIANVSESVMENLISSVKGVDPGKCFVFENVLSVNYLKSASKEEVSDMPDDGSIKLLSVGRFGDAKNFDNVPEICSKIVASGLDVKWYIIGFGSQEQLIKDKIKQYGMQDRVIIMGKRSNPYPYMARCDLYVQPSRYEGKAVTVREAQSLGKPVVITDFSTAKSQVRDGIDGVIVPLDNAGCANGIVEVLRNKELMTALRNNCSESDYSNKSELSKLDLIWEERGLQYER